MTLVIIGEVKLKQVQSSQLKWDPTGHPLWFNGLEQDLYIVIGEQEIRHFEITFKNHFLSGGASKALQYGIIHSGGSKVGQDLSRTVDYQTNMPDEIIVQAKEVIESCINLETEIKKGLLEYLLGFSFGSNPLRFNASLKSYVPFEKRRIPGEKFNLRKFISRLNLPKHLRLKVVGFLIVIGAIISYVTTIKSKGQEFLKMDERMNVSFIDKYVSASGNLLVVDSNKRNILHRLAKYMDGIDDEQFIAFKYLVLTKKLDPNTFDINGKTPLYYVISRHLNPPTEIKKTRMMIKGEVVNLRDVFFDKHYDLIEKLLKMGLKSRIKKRPKDLSAWELGRQDADLRLLMEKYL